DNDLTLHYYGELNDSSQHHIKSCAACAERFETLRRDLDALPIQDCEPDELAATRMAARVTEKIKQPHRRLWLPALGATAAAALVLVVTFTSSPPPEVQPVAQVQPTPITAAELDEAMPDVDFLENLELIRDLELLAQIEGV
ncbi:MAG: hypothetical protein GWN30_03760, partial [Gammaproteobacteria bacterium]|nr:hypothetical protein [Phycisphaerae bacterium]NIW43904.1 hypothetical protein [Gammaproteobacteria bacterium]NIX00032.1 hypothetical protein [Phycisphaerae bacterium]